MGLSKKYFSEGRYIPYLAKESMNPLAMFVIRLLAASYLSHLVVLCFRRVLV